METVQFITNILASFGVVIALVVLIIGIIKNTESKRFESFITLLEQYDKLVNSRKEKFLKIKEVVRKSDKTKKEIHDKQNSLSYLLLRLDQSEPLFAIEHGLLDLEIRCLCYLNELCKMTESNQRAKRIILLKESNELTYYKTRLNDLLKLYQSEKKIRHFFVPKYNYLVKIDVEKYFDQTIFN